VGPGLALQKILGSKAEVVATIICGDNYFASNIDKATEEAIQLITPYKPDLFFSGPAFEAGRYGISCGALCKVVGEKLGIPAITGMYEENPGVELYRGSCYIAKTGNSAARMGDDLTRMVNIGLKLISGEKNPRFIRKESIGKPSEDGYFPRGVLKNEYTEKTAAERSVDMLLAKIHGKPFTSEVILPKFDKVNPPPPIKSLSSCEIALVSDGGLCPKGNPHGLSGRGNTVWCTYEIEHFFSDQKKSSDYEIVHTGYFPVEVLENPYRLVPVDAMRDLEREGKIKKLHQTFFCTSGNATVAKVCAKMGNEMAAELRKRGIQAIILTST
jgi:glycine reductase